MYEKELKRLFTLYDDGNDNTLFLIADSFLFYPTYTILYMLLYALLIVQIDYLSFYPSSCSSGAAHQCNNEDFASTTAPCSLTGHQGLPEALGVHPSIALSPSPPVDSPDFGLSTAYSPEGYQAGFAEFITVDSMCDRYFYPNHGGFPTLRRLLDTQVPDGCSYSAQSMSP